jgi:hypothetical protein
MLGGSVRDDVEDGVAIGTWHALGSVWASQTSVHVTAAHGTSRGIVGLNGDGLIVAVGDLVGLTDGEGDGLTDGEGEGDGVAVTCTIAVGGLVLAV